MNSARRQRLSRAVPMLIGLLAAAAALAQRADGDAGQRAAFRAAYDEARLGIGGDAATDPPELRSYILYPYLEAVRLEIDVLGASGELGSLDERAAAFLQIHGDAPVGRGVRRTWLRRLAERGHWAAFLDAYRSGVADDRMRCQYLAARIETDRISGLAPAIAEQWLTPRQLPLECEPVFQWLRDEGLLTDDLVAERVVGLLENGQSGFARVIARRLPRETAQPLETWAAFVAEPLAAIDAWLANPTPVPDRALLDGWSRLSRNAPQSALPRAEPLVSSLAARDRDPSRYALALALGLAWDRRPETLAWFARVAPEDLDDYALGWLARAALWAGRWRLAADTILAMSEAERSTSAWRYWAARSAEAGGDRRAARAAYQALLPDDNFYSAMAGARLGRRVEPHAEPLARDDRLLAELASQPAYRRARELAAVGLRSEATLEWQTGAGLLDEARRLQSIHLAAAHELYDIAVATATRYGVFADYAVLYPRPFETTVERAARAHGTAPNLVLALIRQESLFRSDAASGSGALGLMQLRPETAVRAARAAGLPEPAARDLFDPDTNVSVGSAHLKGLLAEFGDRLPVALAAYNAGPAAARRWLPPTELDADVWIENIPYNETRAYVRRVLWHRVVFDWLESGRGIDLETWLEPVPPASDGG